MAGYGSQPQVRVICRVVVLDLEMASFNYITMKRNLQLCYITSPLMMSSDDSDNERMMYFFVAVEYQLKRLLSLVNAEHWITFLHTYRKVAKSFGIKLCERYSESKEKIKLQLFKANRTRKFSTFVTFWLKIIQRLPKGPT